MRLQKFLSKAGVASRRASEKLILQGRIKVNGKIVKELGTKINPDLDEVEFDGKICKFNNKAVYIIKNKPKGVLTTLKDPLGRRTVIDLLKGVGERVFPVGRLDKDTEGLLLLTNDGDVTYKLTHPKYEIKKTYRACANGIINTKKIKALEKGIILEDGMTAPANARIIKIKKDSTIIEIKIHEGRNRQVRRMFKAIGHPVLKLKRTKIGKLSLKDLKTGVWRFLSQNEIDYIKNL